MLRHIHPSSEIHAESMYIYTQLSSNFATASQMQIISCSITITEGTIKRLVNNLDQIVNEAYIKRILRKTTVHKQELVLQFSSLYLIKK